MHVNLRFGGKQPIMHDTQITDGCLGMHAPKLQVGDIKKWFFKTQMKVLFTCLRQIENCGIMIESKVEAGRNQKP